jgi:hypothetical protein
VQVLVVHVDAMFDSHLHNDCRVVTISDLAAHLPLPLGAAAAGNAAGGGGGGWEPWSGHDPVAALEGPEAAQQRRTALLGLLAEVQYALLLMLADQIGAACCWWSGADCASGVAEIC